jgi:hypothetical protein
MRFMMIPPFPRDLRVHNLQSNALRGMWVRGPGAPRRASRTRDWPADVSWHSGLRQASVSFPFQIRRGSCCSFYAAGRAAGLAGARWPVGKDRRRTRVAIVFFASAIVLFATAFLAAEGWRRWLLMAIFGFPGAFAFWLGAETLRRPRTASDDDQMDEGRRGDG